MRKKNRLKRICLTILELVEKYVSLKTGVRHNTVARYKTVINMLKKEDFGKWRIDKVRLSDAKAWLIKLQQIDGRGYSSIHSIRGALRPAFQMAVDDDLLRKHPICADDRSSCSVFSQNHCQSQDTKG